MELLPIAILLGVFFFWTAMLANVHREFKGTGYERNAMTFTFLTLGIVGLVLLAEHGKKPVFSFGLLKRFKSKKPKPAGLGKPDVWVQEGAAEITFITHDGKSSGFGTTEVMHGETLTAIKEIFQQAIRDGATDIHLEPEPAQLKVRYRLDGVLQNLKFFPAPMSSTMVSALKVLGGLDVSEKRRAQDGSFSGTFEGRSVDFRISTAGASHGEILVVRILDKRSGLRRLQNLGLSQPMYEQLRQIVNSPHGMLVACGPTGCGKTTTIYAALQEIDRVGRNVITIEDPIEYHLENVTQHSINEKAGITFASILRTGLRQDPDILMVGEVRDPETAEISMQAAMTGHIVYTTLHANDAVSAVFRLMNLKVQPYIIATSVRGILAQRLVRKLCIACRIPHKPKPDELKVLGSRAECVKVLYSPKGCQKCRETGYWGRIGVFELLVFNDEVRAIIQQSPVVTDLKAAAVRAGMAQLRDDALEKTVQGIASLEEALAATS